MMGDLSSGHQAQGPKLWAAWVSRWGLHRCAVRRPESAEITKSGISLVEVCCPAGPSGVGAASSSTSLATCSYCVRRQACLQSESPRFEPQVTMSVISRCCLSVHANTHTREHPRTRSAA
eukprot:15468464-Alexandrium_andersonii.AAC.1